MGIIDSCTPASWRSGFSPREMAIWLAKPGVNRLCRPAAPTALPLSYLLYVPHLAFLRAAGIPPQLQDGLAIAFVQAVTVGLIALLAYIGSRSLLNRGPALAVACLCIGLPLLLRPVDFGSYSALSQRRDPGQCVPSGDLDHPAPPPAW